MLTLMVADGINSNDSDLGIGMSASEICEVE
jgi:hypothetical protein